MKARDCEEHRILRFNASNAQCDIDCPYCRIAELEAEKQSLFTAAKHHLLENKKLQARLKRWGKTRWK